MTRHLVKDIMRLFGYKFKYLKPSILGYQFCTNLCVNLCRTDTKD